MEKIRTAAGWLREASAAQRKIVRNFMGHLPPLEAGMPGDVDFFSRLVRATGVEGVKWIRENLHEGDLYFFLGYQQNEDAMAAAANALGVRTIFITSRGPGAELAVSPRHVYINPHWPVTDGCLDLPGYDVKACPLSCIMNLTCYYAILRARRSRRSQPSAYTKSLPMDLFDAIANRYSYRGEFTAASVPRKSTWKRSWRRASTPLRRATSRWRRFVIVDDRNLLRQIAEIMGKPVCHSATAMIACVADPRPVFAGLSFAAEDCAAAAENMLLAITALGYASVWLDGALRTENRAARIGQLLGVPSGKTIRILLPIGVPAEPGRQREKLPFDRRAWFNRYGGKG